MVPADETQARIPYARVNHNKYMVTERASYIGKCPQDHLREGKPRALGPGPPSDPHSTPVPRNLQLVWKLLHRDSRHLPAGDTERAWWLAQPVGGCFRERLEIPVQPRSRHLSRQRGQCLPPALRLSPMDRPTPSRPLGLSSGSWLLSPCPRFCLSRCGSVVPTIRLLLPPPPPA